MPIIDIHVHLAGVGSSGSGCHVSAKMRRTLVFGIMRRVLGLDVNDPMADRTYAERMASLIQQAAHIDRAVVFGMDGVYGDDGQIVLDRSHLYVPNDHLFQMCQEFPVFLPGPSVNPARRDALEELERCAARGAVLIKWLPPLQLFDPSDQRWRPFYKAMARLKLPLLGHTGCEHTFPQMEQRYGHPINYQPALDEGVTVIFAHCGAACKLHRAHDRLDQVLELMAAHPNVYADTSALCSILKSHQLSKIPFDQFPGRFVHGSDYPIPPLAIPYVRKLGLSQTIRLTRDPNPFEVDWQIKTVVGVPEWVFSATAKLLDERIQIWDRIRSANKAT